MLKPCIYNVRWEALCINRHKYVYLQTCLQYHILWRFSPTGASCLSLFMALCTTAYLDKRKRALNKNICCDFLFLSTPANWQSTPIYLPHQNPARTPLPPNHRHDCATELFHPFSPLYTSQYTTPDQNRVPAHSFSPGRIFQK